MVTFIVLTLLWFPLALECHKRLSDPMGLLKDVPRFRGGLGTGREYVKGQALPKPQKEVRTGVLFTLSPNSFEFVSVGRNSDIVMQAIKRYVPLVFPDADMPVDNKLDAVKVMVIDVKEDYKPMHLTTDESYTLIVASPQSSLTANTPFGALRGLETFSQLVYQNLTGSYFVAENNIDDFPRFHHRGFLIDTSRNFVSVKVINQFIDAMAYSKFNVLHWHIVDRPSFPYVSDKYPMLHGKGAFNNQTHIYTKQDIRDIRRYGELRGVRIMPEFDTPGHTTSWQSIPNFLTKCYSGGKPNGELGPVDPTVESNYDFLEKFFAEVITDFPDDYIHMGGDEVSFSCWESNPNIVKWMQAKGMGKNYALLEQYYEQRLLDIMKKLGKQYVIWQEVVDNGVKVQDETVVNIWRGHAAKDWGPEIARITKMGYRTILSSPWYLNYISYGDYGEDWQQYYTPDPGNWNGTKAQKDLVMGGTACMWGEMTDGTNLISRTWARGCTVGERLWSAETVTDLNDVADRLWEHRCRYVRRGLPAENVRRSEFCHHEWRVNYTQGYMP